MALHNLALVRQAFIESSVVKLDYGKVSTTDLSSFCQIALTRQSISVTTCDPFHMHHLPGGTYQCPHSIFHLPISDLGVRRLESAQARHTCDEENNFEAWTATS